MGRWCWRPMKRCANSKDLGGRRHPDLRPACAGAGGPACAGPSVVWALRHVPTTANSSSGRDKLVESFGWSIPCEGLAGSGVEEVGDLVEVVLAVDGEVGAFGEELSHKAVPVLVG